MDRKTKIIVTLGPAVSDAQRLGELIRAGMNVARINTSHADQNEIARQISLLREVAAAENSLVGVMLDLSGPKIRVDNVAAEGYLLEAGAELTLGTVNDADLKVRPEVGFKEVGNDARVMLDDGKIHLRVIEHISESILKVQVVYGGRLFPNKGVNFPGVALDVPALTQADESNLRFGLRQGIDWVALSFVRSPEDRQGIETIFDEVGIRVPVMAKVEKPEAVQNLDSIIDVFDGIMVARGDLGVEMPLEEVPLIQKNIIAACNEAGKPVVTATQLLDSMISAPTPTRAEVNDVANAIFDGTDALMLSNETAVGDYPIKAVETLNSIALATEAAALARQTDRVGGISVTIGSAISHAACTIARECSFPVIVTMTHSGITARGVARFRPQANIVACSPAIEVCRQLQLVWGVRALPVDELQSTDEMVANAERELLKHGLITKGEYFVFTAGVPSGMAGTTNLLKVHQVGGH